MSNHDREDPRQGKGDATLDRAWRQVSDERPPAQLDAAIIASARKAVQDRDDVAKVTRTGRRSRNWLTGWQPLVAAAGVAGFAFVLVQSLPRDGDVAPSIQIEEAASGPIGMRDGLPSPSASNGRDEKAGVAKAPASAEASAAPADSEELKQAVPAPPSPPASVPRAESPARALDEKSPVGGTAPMRAAEADPRPATAPELSSQAVSDAAVAPAGESGNVGPLSADDRAARVVALHASGDVAGAADALRAFRAADPDADMYLPDSLRRWARTVE